MPPWALPSVPADSKDYPVDTKPVTAPQTYKPPTVSTGKSSLNDILIALGDKCEALGKPLYLLPTGCLKS